MITRYALRNGTGKWFRGGGREPWTTDESKVKLYATLGRARAIRTRLLQFGVSQIIKLESNPIEIDDSVNVKKARIRAVTKRERQAVRRAELELIGAKRIFEEARQRLEAAKAK